MTSGSGFGPTPPPSGTAARNYVQQIAYDPVGNLSSVQHFVPGQSSASWTRLYGYPVDSNRLSSDTVGGVTSSYGYDSAGNMSSMPHLPGSGATAGLQWSWANQLAQTYSSSSAAARYAYGGDGQRVVKRFGSLSGSVLTPSKVTVYLPGGFEITGSFSGGALQVEWQSLAVMDDRTCVARFEVKAVDGGVATGEAAVLRYQVGNHLGSACLETSEAGQVLTREEYYPYGGTAYAFVASGAAGFSVKRYRYAGKECDSENGLYYFGARYFAAWLGRWTAGDPVFAAGRSAYEYCHSNPTTKVDPDGREPDQPNSPPVELPEPGVGRAGATDQQLAYALRERDRALEAEEAVRRSPLVLVADRSGNGVMMHEGEVPEFRRHQSVQASHELGERLLGATGNPIGLTTFWGSQALGNDLASSTAHAEFANSIADVVQAGRTAFAGVRSAVGAAVASTQVGITHGHHSDPKFMGGDPKQPLTAPPAGTHRSLHKDMGNFLRQRQDAFGNHMRPQRGNSGPAIQENFTRQERLAALRDFYRQFGNKYVDAARDFFKQQKGL